MRTSVSVDRSTLMHGADMSRSFQLIFSLFVLWSQHLVYSQTVCTATFIKLRTVSYPNPIPPSYPALVMSGDKSKLHNSGRKEVITRARGRSRRSRCRLAGKRHTSVTLDQLLKGQGRSISREDSVRLGDKVLFAACPYFRIITW